MKMKNTKFSCMGRSGHANTFAILLNSIQMMMFDVLCNSVSHQTIDGQSLTDTMANVGA
jgi:hypothetical protein